MTHPGSRLILILALLLAGATAGQVFAQRQDSDEQQQGEQEQAQAETGQQGAAQDDDSLTGAAEAEEEQNGEDGEFERFIPTEQVSRDLGVSFPADI